MFTHFEIAGEGLAPAFLALELVDQGHRVTWIRSPVSDHQSYFVQRASPGVWGKVKRAFTRHNLLVQDLDLAPVQNGWVFSKSKGNELGPKELDRDWQTVESYKWIPSYKLSSHLTDLCSLRGIQIVESKGTSIENSGLKIDFRFLQNPNPRTQTENLLLKIHLKPLQQQKGPQLRKEALVCLESNGVQLIAEPHPEGGWIISLRGQSIHAIERELEFCFSKKGPVFFQSLGFGTLEHSPRVWQKEVAYSPRQKLEISEGILGLGNFWGRQSSVFHSDLQFEFSSVERFMMFYLKIIRIKDWEEKLKEIANFNDYELNFSKDFAFKARLTEKIVLKSALIRNFVPAFSPQIRAEFPSPL